METITITPENPVAVDTVWRASSGGQQSLGKTAGEALDNLTPLLDDQTSGAVVMIQPMRPDRFFTVEQRNRLETLMGRWRAARDLDEELPPEETAELEALVEAQLEGAARRAEAMPNRVKR